jgi:hypothetical protein
MRKLILLFLIFACAFAQAQQAAKPAQQAKPAPAQAQKPAAQQAKPAAQTLDWCRLGTDPVDPSRQPDWAAECVVKASTTPVTMLTGSGKQVRCILPPLTPVVVDRQSGAAKWVLACGNPILQPANWVPAGTRICGPETAQPAAAQSVTPAPAATPTAPTEVRVSGEVRHVHSGEVRVVHEGTVRQEVPASESAPAQAPAPTPQPALLPVQAPAPTPQPKKGWWSRNAKWIVPVAIGAGAGAAVALTRGGQKTIQYQPLPPPLYRP